MKVILLKNIQKLGLKFDVKNVSDGYALNFLIPNGQAEIATPNALKKVELEKAKISAELKVRETLLLKNLKDVSTVVLKISGKANDKGALFAGIHKEEISAQIKKQTHLDITPEFIDLEKPIKTVGEHEMLVKVGDKVAKFKLVVVAL
mgnify:CR=1 FL=1